MQTSKRGRYLLSVTVLCLAQWVLALESPVLAEDGDDLMQREPWESCVYCHAATSSDGIPPIPVINGQSGAYLEKQLADYRAGRRVDPSGMMVSALILLDETDQRRVSDYFSRQSAPAWDGAAKWSEGASLYWKGRTGLPACAGCHGSARSGASLPSLFGQGRQYLIGQLNRFGEGARSNDRGRVMRWVAMALDANEIEALADYLADD